jgi:hypothetical protein
MAVTGELIRSMNYVDDIATTLRRIGASVTGMDLDERKRLAEHLRIVGTNLTTIASQIEKGA